MAARLTDDDITRFVKSISPVVFTAMFSKIGSTDSAAALHNLASLRPELVIPPLLEKSVSLHWSSVNLLFNCSVNV